jgi:NADH-quinone oxidoreductase subunit J
MELAVFLLFALLAVASTIVVVAHRNPVYSTLALVAALFSVAVLFVMLGAPFIGALQVLIYAGAILVLFLFVLMLLNVERDETPAGHRPQLVTALLSAAVFCGMLVLLFWGGGSAAKAPPLTEAMVSLTGLARELFTAYLLQFEIVGLLLLVAVIGATVVARRPGADAQTAADLGLPAAPFPSQGAAEEREP